MVRSSRATRGLVAVILMTSNSAQALAGQCGFRHAFSRPDERGTAMVKVFRGDAVADLGNAPLLFITALKVNTDGTKISYHQDDPTGRRCQADPSATPCAINNIQNAYSDLAKPVSAFTAVRDAGYPNPRTWQVLSPDIIEMNASTGKPCITPDGYLVSMTADVAVDDGRRRIGDCDPSKWIDALTAPAIVLPKRTRSRPSQFLDMGLRQRSLVVAVSRSASKRVVPGIVGDLGPTNELGEASIAMNRDLNGLAATDQPKHRQDAINRFQAGRTAVLLFPGTDFVLARPITGARIAEAGKDALAKFGGADKLYGCIRDEIDPAF
ncbi:MAG TPA: hypothetical protein VHN20_05770 [Beijerinckiaceae bacterium]|nr:hypothetical protein [Beijerinckiaceae bacterium]